MLVQFGMFLGGEFGKWIGNKVKEEIKHDLKLQRQRLKEHKQNEIQATLKILDENLDLLNDEDIKKLKKIIDIQLDNKYKTEELTRNQLIRSVKNRIHNKKLIFEDHREIRKEIEKMAQEKLYSKEYSFSKEQIIQPQQQIQREY